MSIRYQVVILSETRQDDGTQEGVSIEAPVLNLYVDQLHEAGPKLSALYPVPALKRAHRRKGLADAGFERRA